MTNQRLKIQIVGPYPPPQGGISVHIQRLVETIQHDHDVEVLDPYRSVNDIEVPCRYRVCGGGRLTQALRLGIALAVTSPDIRHLHVSSFRTFASIGRLLHVLPAQSMTLGVTIHGGSFPSDFVTSSASRRRKLARIIAGFDFVIAVNSEIAEIAYKVGVPRDRVFTMPAFIPASYDDDVHLAHQMETLSAAGKKIVVASGYGIPLYGYHVLLAALERGFARRKSVVPVICLYNSFDEAYTTEVAESARRMGGEVFRDLSPQQFSTILRHSDVFVRPTDRDGDAVSVREALWMGKPTIASNAVLRPESVLLFETGDAADLALRLVDALTTRDEAAYAGRDIEKALDWPMFYRGIHELGKSRR